MTIHKKTYEQIIIAFTSAPIESGGMLGQRDGKINAFYFDSTAVTNGCEYIPDVGTLNRVIEEWSADGTQFAGIIHSHANGQSLLSPQDEHYAQTIFDMNNALKVIYFPVVIYIGGKPEIVAYRYNGAWQKDKLTLI